MSGGPPMLALVGAEVSKLLTRASVRLTLGAMVLAGVGVPALMFLLTLVVEVSPEAREAGADPFSFELARVLSTTLMLRNFFVFRAGLIAIVAVSFAGEFVARTLREDLVRPVSRGAVLAAKWGAVQVIVALATAIPLLLASLVGAVLFGVDGDLREALLGYALTWLGDAGFATLVVAISTVLRSVPGTIGGVFLYWVVDRALGWLLWAVEKGRSFLDALLDAWKMADLKQVLDRLEQARPWLPSSAFDVYWEQGLDEPVAWASFAALAMYTALSYAVAWWVFQRVDVD